MIRYVTDSGLVTIDDGMCRESSEMISESILSRPGYFHVTDDAVLMTDSTEELIQFYNTISQMKRYLRPGLTVPPSIKKIIQDSGHRYGMAVMSYGIKRSSVNKRVLFALDFIINLFTKEGVYVGSRELFRSGVIIFDTQTDCVVYFHNLRDRAMNPLNKTLVRNYLSGLVSNYKWVF